MLKPLTKFYCDKCNEVIESPKEGYIEWLSEIDEHSHRRINSGYKIVHDIDSSPMRIFTGRENGCFFYNDCSLALDEFLEDRDIQLLNFIDPDPFKTGSPGQTPKDLSEYIEFVRRLTFRFMKRLENIGGKP